MSVLARNLKYLMKKNSLSANQLQAKTGITQSTTSRILNGKTTKPRTDLIEKYANYFGVSVDWLIAGEDEIQITTLADRLKKSRQLTRKTQETVAFEVGIKQPTYQALESGKITGSSHLLAIAQALNVDPYWLATGKGEMQTKQTIPNNPQANDFNERNTIPVVSWVAAASWTECQSVTLDDVIEELPRPIMMHDKCFALKVRGESMLPDFKPDEYIYIDSSYKLSDLKNGDFIVVLEAENHEATFKQLVIGETSDDMYLRSLNPHWHEQKLQPKSQWQFIGKAIGKWVKL